MFVILLFMWDIKLVCFTYPEYAFGGGTGGDDEGPPKLGDALENNLFLCDFGGKGGAAI